MADVTLSITTELTDWTYSQEADEDRLLPALFRAMGAAMAIRAHEVAELKAGLKALADFQRFMDQLSGDDKPAGSESDGFEGLAEWEEELIAARKITNVDVSVLYTLDDGSQQVRQFLLDTADGPIGSEFYADIDICDVTKDGDTALRYEPGERRAVSLKLSGRGPVRSEPDPEILVTQPVPVEAPADLGQVKP